MVHVQLSISLLSSLSLFLTGVAPGTRGGPPALPAVLLLAPLLRRGELAIVCYWMGRGCERYYPRCSISVVQQANAAAKKARKE